MLQVLYYAYIKMSLIDRFHRLICKKCNKYFSERIITLQDIVGISKKILKQKWIGNVEDYLDILRILDINF